MPLYSEEGRRVAFRAVANPQLWSLAEKPAYLVMTEKNWSTYYSSPPQGSDFDKCIYIVASLGMKPNPGYRVRILQLQQEKEKIIIKAELGEPDPKKSYAQVMVYPIAVAEVPKANLQPYNLLTFVFIDQEGHQIATVKAEI